MAPGVMVIVGKSEKVLWVHDIVILMTASLTLPLVLVVVNHRLLRHMAAQAAFILHIYPETTLNIVMIN